jgi:hypothetical protein
MCRLFRATDDTLSIEDVIPGFRLWVRAALVE